MEIKTKTELHRMKLIEYLSNPENDFPSRRQLGRLALGVTRKTLYQHFTPAQLSEIENEAVRNRREASAPQRVRVMEALYQRAIGYRHPETKTVTADGVVTKTLTMKVFPPDKGAAQEFLDRTEGKVVEKKEITGAGGVPLVPTLNVTLTES